MKFTHLFKRPLIPRSRRVHSARVDAGWLRWEKEARSDTCRARWRPRHAPAVLYRGAGPAAEEVQGRRHPPTAEEERDNQAPDPNDGVAAVSGIEGRVMVMVLVSDADRMVMLLVGVAIGW